MNTGQTIFPKLCPSYRNMSLINELSNTKAIIEYDNLVVGINFYV